MKKIIFLIVLLFFTIYIQAAQKTIEYLFINSNPIKAKVIIDGKDSGIRTPCLLKNLSSNVKKITISKEGFVDYNIKYYSKLKTQSLDVHLAPKEVVLHLPDEANYIFGNNEIRGPVYISGLSNGNYRFKLKNDGIYIIKKSNLFPLEIVLGTSFLFSVAAMSVSIGLSQFYGYQSRIALNDFDRVHNDILRNTFDIGMYITIPITAIIAVIFFGVFVGDLIMRQFDKKRMITISKENPNNDGKSLYDSAVKSISAGNISESNGVLINLISMYSDSKYLPRAYYQLGQNNYILGDYDSALNYWNTYITEYPIAEYYDYVIKNIADIYFQKRDYKNAVNTVEKLVMSGNDLDKETILSFKSNLKLECFKIDKNLVNSLSIENDFMTLINDFNRSDRLDYYFLKLIELYNMIGDTDKLITLKNKAEDIEDPLLKDLILSYFD